MQSPELQILMAREQHQDRMRQAEMERRLPKPIDIHPMRKATGTALLAIATRIDPTPRTARPTVTIGGMKMAGRADS